jgi:inorganic triphosphatase YgiF
METELKLSVSPGNLHAVHRRRLLEHFVVAGPVSLELSARYFDTKACALHVHGLDLRVRKDGDAWTQTLKRGGAAGAIERDEWEAPVGGPAPELAGLRAVAGLPRQVAKLLRAIGADGGLEEKFSVGVKRETWKLRVAESEVEMALDEGVITCGAASLPVSEIEFELKAGDKAALYALAAELAGHIPVLPGDASKSARGYALCRGKPDAPRKAGAIALSRKLSVEEGIRAILGNCLHHAQANVRGIVETDDPEYLHQMRVGMRRFRSALKLFGKWLVLPPAMQEELDWLGAVLGSARDHDVFNQSTLPAIADDIQAGDSLRPLAERAAAAAAEQRAELRRALHSARYGQFMLSLCGWVDCGGWRSGMDAGLLASLEKGLPKFARKAVARGHAKIERRGRHLDRHDARSLHVLRIACKQNRYTVEFFRALARGTRAGEYIDELASLQDVLGARNDVTVAQRIVHELEEGHPALAHAAGFAAGYLGCRAAAGLGGIRKGWRRFSALRAARLFH